jgi:nitrate reductase alpha subunit
MKLFAIARYDVMKDKFLAVLRGGSFFSIPDEQAYELGIEDGDNLYVVIERGYESCKVVEKAA